MSTALFSVCNWGKCDTKKRSFRTHRLLHGQTGKSTCCRAISGCCLENSIRYIPAFQHLQVKSTKSGEDSWLQECKWCAHGRTCRNDRAAIWNPWLIVLCSFYTISPKYTADLMNKKIYLFLSLKKVPLLSTWPLNYSSIRPFLSKNHTRSRLWPFCFTQPQSPF